MLSFLITETLDVQSLNSTEKFGTTPIEFEVIKSNVKVTITFVKINPTKKQIKHLPPTYLTN